jgi:DNA-binding response OmpR family regulator
MLRVLIVDDYPDTAESLGYLVSTWGHVVACCKTSEDALQTARAFRPSVALLDIAMPRIDGFELGKRFREQDETKNTVLISVTGLQDGKYRQRSIDEGFALHLVKPDHIEELKSFLAKLAPGTKNADKRWPRCG